ncbi:MAG TPA: short-chain dehydrogenase/reductase [Firmicutes bacterium]|jgi:short-subunit dehydrogenase|nr:short-chain dehydrogenase/reductase [Bacillota bacterium]HBK67642.1 short-chain dehydrogenase/reductase [Bacillota bacterium]HBT18008.1 short-chain dehydrogenase/reductase [Bacillota bacterium]
MGKGLSGKNVLITGASSGMGAAIALTLAKKGYQVWGTTRDLSKVANLPGELRQNIKFLQMDVTKDDSVCSGFSRFLTEAGGIDILINNAGFGVFGPLEEFSIEKTKEIFETNYFGALRLIQEVAPIMREQRRGLIINITSLAAKFVIPFQVHYSATKFALDALTEGLRQELRPFGVKVVAIEPGDIKTNFNNVTKFGIGENSPYKKWADVCWRVIDVNMQKSPPPQVIADKVVKVIAKRNPRTRYPAGDFLSTKFPIIDRFISSRLKEKMIRLFYGVDFK